MGPERGMLFTESRQKWEQRIEDLLIALKNQAIFQPLIATDIWGEIYLSDGSHRHEALIRNKRENYWTVFFVTKKESYLKIMEKKIR